VIEMELENMNQIIAITDIAIEKGLDTLALNKAQERYFSAVNDIENKLGYGEEFARLERSFLDYVELVRFYYFQLGVISKEVDEYRLSYNPFQRIKKDWEKENTKNEEKKQEQEAGKDYTSIEIAQF